MNDVLSRAGRVIDGVVVERLRRRRNDLIERAPRVAERLYRRANTVANLPFRAETIELPAPVEVNGVRLDVVSDLALFTQLPRDVVEHELRTRSGVSFRAEWHATPEHLRRDHWFYLSSKAYLFGNATHFADTAFADRFVRPHADGGEPVLDFGGGTGNLALMLAAGGMDVWVSELNALQRDFVRFRVQRLGLQERVRVADPWEDLPRRTFAAVLAVDVLEHLPDCREVLERRLLPALADRGVLVENSPFIVNSANPMHHLDFGFEPFMHAAGFAVLSAGDEGTRVWRRG